MRIYALHFFFVTRSIHSHTFHFLFSSVTPVNAASLADTKQNSDDRRNLYVLGLPFALTKNELASLFSRFGTVSHCVILATVDNSSRRRGFVVMSTHAEAKQALIALTRTQLKGHTIDVSWAVVQRSQGYLQPHKSTLKLTIYGTGFLDGGDRAMLLDARSHVHPSGASHHDRRSFPSSDYSDSSSGSNEPDPATLKTTSMPTSSLLVINLPTLLFSQIQDLHPLFYPFGPIEKLEIVHILPSGTMSVIVRYTTSTIAQEAKEALHGQRYGINQLEVRFVQTSATVVNCDPSCDFIPSAKDPAAYLHSNPRTHAHFLLGPTASSFQHDNQKTCGFSRFGLMHESLFSSPASPPSFSVLRDHNSSRPCLTNSRWSADSLQRNQGFAVGRYPAFAEEAFFTGYSDENFPA